MKELFKKLLLIQQEVGAITKDSENPYFKSFYFDVNGLLSELKPVLNKHGVVVLQPLTNIDGKPALKTIVIDESSGDRLEEVIVLPDIQDPQKIGSAITYYRRYSLQSMFLLQAEDDDGNKASGKDTKPAKQTTKEYQKKNREDYENSVDPLIDEEDDVI